MFLNSCNSSLTVLVALSSGQYDGYGPGNVNVNINQNQVCIQNGLNEADLIAFFKEGKKFCNPRDIKGKADLICFVVELLQSLGLFDHTGPLKPSDTAKLTELVNAGLAHPDAKGLDILPF